MGVELALLHALYVICLLTIITFLFSGKILQLFVSFYLLLALTATSSIPLAVSGIFKVLFTPLLSYYQLY